MINIRKVENISKTTLQKNKVLPLQVKTSKSKKNNFEAILQEEMKRLKK